MEVYIPKQEKRSPDNETQPDKKKKVKTTSHEPVFAIEAPKAKAKAKEKEKRAPDTEAQPEQKKKVKTQSHEPTLSIEAPKSKAKAKEQAKTNKPENEHEPKGSRGRPKNIQAIDTF